MSTKQDREIARKALEEQRARLDARVAGLEQEAARFRPDGWEGDRKCILQADARAFHAQSDEIGRQIADLLKQDLAED